MRPPPGRSPPGVWGDGRRARIGLLGGSFNPAHDGHRHVAEQALRRLRLDEVWLLVSPGNPLKPRRGMAPFATRLDSARRIADGRRILATDMEQRLGTRYTVDTLAQLRRRFPRARFVLLVGADNLSQLPRWKRWREIARTTPIAVVPRPAETRPALHGRAARHLARYRRRPAALLAARPGEAPHGASPQWAPAQGTPQRNVPQEHAPQGRALPGHAIQGQALPDHAPWCLVPVREHPASATAIRAALGASFV